MLRGISIVACAAVFFMPADNWLLILFLHLGSQDDDSLS